KLRDPITVDVRNDRRVGGSIDPDRAWFVRNGCCTLDWSGDERHDLRNGQRGHHREPRDGRGAASARDRGRRHGRGSIAPPNRSGIMPGMAPPRVLWSPPDDARAHTRVGHYLDWLAVQRGRRFDDYQALWGWSVDDLEGFWGSLADYFGVQFDAPPRSVLESLHMPGANWFAGARLNWAGHALRLAGRAHDDVVVIAHSETRPEQRLTADELRDAVARVRTGLLRLGIRQGDRVAAYLPNVPEAVIAL